MDIELVLSTHHKHFWMEKGILLTSWDQPAKYDIIHTIPPKRSPAQNKHPGILAPTRPKQPSKHWDPKIGCQSERLHASAVSAKSANCPTPSQKKSPNEPKIAQAHATQAMSSAKHRK